MLDCYRTLCQSSSSLRIHPIVLQQLRSSLSPTSIQLPTRPPPTLDSATLQPLFHSLRVEPGVLTFFSLPAVSLQTDAVAAFARSICYSQASFLPLPTRLAYSELFPSVVFPPLPINQPQEPLPRALSRLTHISLSGVKPSSTHFDELIASFALLPSLTALDLSNTLLTDECLPALCFLVHYSSSITALNMSHSFFTAESPIDRNRLVTAFLASKSLTQLDLSHSHLSLETSTALLPTLVRLQHLNLSALRCLQLPDPPTAPQPSAPADDRPALSLFYSSLYRQLTSPLCRLTSIMLHDISDVGGHLSAVVCLALAAPSCRLRCVELCSNNLVSTGVRRLLAVLRMRNETLRRLVLDGNVAVSDEAACKQLVEWIAPMQPLAGGSQARLSECMRDDSVTGAGEMRALCGLEELSIRNCGLSAVSQKQLLALCPSTCSHLTLHV